MFNNSFHEIPSTIGNVWICTVSSLFLERGVQEKGKEGTKYPKEKIPISMLKRKRVEMKGLLMKYAESLFKYSSTE